jgi:hypothetical protein
VLAACTDLPTSPSLHPDDSGAKKLIVWIPGAGDSCDPWLDLNWCEGDKGPGGVCVTSATPGDGGLDRGVDAETCEIGGSGGSGGEPDPPQDTCVTGNEILDSPAVRSGLDDLWKRSSASAEQSQRLEQAGWIVRRPDGTFGMAPFTTTAQGPCNVNGNLNAPFGAVAWVHTHPFRTGEIQTICGALKEPDPATGGWRDAAGPAGEPLFPKYENRPSIPDRELLGDVNRTRAGVGQLPLVGVIVDADKTTAYTEDAADGIEPYPRCGY